MAETLDAADDICVWRIKRCGDDIRLAQEPIPEVEAFLRTHISMTWAFPNNIFVLTKTGDIFKVDLDKKATNMMLKSKRLDELIQFPIPACTFLKAHFDGLLLVMPHVIAVRLIYDLDFLGS